MGRKREKSIYMYYIYANSQKIKENAFNQKTIKKEATTKN